MKCSKSGGGKPQAACTKILKPRITVIGSGGSGDLSARVENGFLFRTDPVPRRQGDNLP